MKTKLLLTALILILNVSFCISGTKRSNTSTYEVILRTNEGTIRAWVSNEKKKINIKSDQFYTGYYMNELFCKQGELQGKPLNGKFQKYDLKNNILESGNFKYGLKDGLWKQLTPNGKLTEIIEYHNGMLFGQRVIYKNGKPDIVEKYKKGKLIEKPEPKKMGADSNKEKNFIQRLMIRKNSKIK